MCLMAAPELIVRKLASVRFNYKIQLWSSPMPWLTPSLLIVECSRGSYCEIKNVGRLGAEYQCCEVLTGNLKIQSSLNSICGLKMYHS